MDVKKAKTIGFAVAFWGLRPIQDDLVLKVLLKNFLQNLEIV
jgi:hypothetical protein